MRPIIYVILIVIGILAMIPLGNVFLSELIWWITYYTGVNGINNTAVLYLLGLITFSIGVLGIAYEFGRKKGKQEGKEEVVMELPPPSSSELMNEHIHNEDQ